MSRGGRPPANLRSLVRPRTFGIGGFIVRKRACILLLAPFVILVSSCDKPETPAGPSAPYSTNDLRTGSGAEATNGKTVTVNYTGWLYSATAPENKGTQFDTSFGKTPFTFVLGAGKVIAGWDRGIVGMKVGGQRRLIIPPDLGYGSQGAGGGVIPSNATLVFDVDLLDVR